MRPNDLARWVTEAPGRTSREIVGYALERWHAVRDGVAAREEAWRHEKVIDRVESRQAIQRVGDLLG